MRVLLCINNWEGAEIAKFLKDGPETGKKVYIWIHLQSGDET